jgi:murein DD-endopeptidase MepM/ murein hydrolase activator NlpD
MSSETHSTRLSRRSGARLLTASLIAAAIVIGAALGSASGQNLQEKLDQTQEKLDKVEAREGVLSSKVQHESNTLDRLQGQVAELRSREAIVAEELAQKQAELEEAQDRLEVLRAHLRRSIALLEERLVEIYKSGEPDMITVLLESNGFDELVARSDYLQALEDRDSTIVDRVRDLRNEMQETVNEIRAARDAIAARKLELEQTRAALEKRSAELAEAKAAHKKTLGDVRDLREQLEGDLSTISDKIAEQLGGLPAGPIRPGEGGFIWPVNGPIVSGFGMRWGRMHEGIDIAVPSGTPILAAKSGNIVLAGPTGGYGNYTCIDHGGGISTCYAHQSSFARTSGFVSQGTVIGYVGCTGHCFGDHLHFEVRINGTAVDPLGYL